MCECVMLVAAISGAASTDPRNPKTSSQNETQQNSRRPPLLPFEKDNGVGPRRPKLRPVPSRYMSPSSSTSTASSISSTSSTSRRCPSLLVSRNLTSVSNTPSSVVKRSISVDRRRPIAAQPLAPDLHLKSSNASENSAATKLLVTSTWSLSVSFHGEAFSLPISKRERGGM